MKLYPLIFQPRFVEKMWGGRSLERVAGKALPPGKTIGESWELFDFPPGTVGPDGRQPGDDPADWTSARVAVGPLAGVSLHEILLSAPRELLGDASPVATPAGPQFPLLIKFLDARQDLSVQVHPPAEYAKTHANAFVKNECWYIIDHEPGARILNGARPGVDRAALEAALRQGQCEEQLNAVPVATGDMFYLPSGTVHALGAGIVAAEVQTPSDTTYRVFDFNRVEPATGKPRSLHIAQAMDCIDFESSWRAGYTPAADADATIVRAPQFTVDRLTLQAGKSKTYTPGTMRVWMVIAGEVSFGAVVARAGQTIVCPAGIEYELAGISKARLLEVKLA